MKLLVRLPNWLGDMVMAVGALNELPFLFPGAQVSVIAKQGLQDLLPFFPPLEHRFIFNKAEFKGPRGLWQFGKKIAVATAPFDLFISFPDSFSSALMGYATGAKVRIGYKGEGRNLLLTQSFVKPLNLHRAEEYARLQELFSGKKSRPLNVSLYHTFPKEDYIAVNINSEAQSRRLTPAKAVQIIDAVQQHFDKRVVLVGGPGEKAFVDAVFDGLKGRDRAENLAGKTSLKGLAQVLASARLTLTTDSGPAHLSNAMGTQTVVLFGAGREANTAPYNKDFVTTLRLGALSCEPCVKNICERFETPQCLERLQVGRILEAMEQKLIMP